MTAYCPTLVTAPLDEYPAALERVRGAQLDAQEHSLPAIIGVHLEGPFLGGAPGAHRVALVRIADCDWLRHVLDTFPGIVAVVTLAPEADLPVLDRRNPATPDRRTVYRGGRRASDVPIALSRRSR